MRLKTDEDQALQEFTDGVEIGDERALIQCYNQDNVGESYNY